ncbi:Nucleotide-binding universal stress protein, UspA family [Variovorax sp. OK605]|uniref:universal stress protein n=1 Tax=Variovorax sp. OK605 TaxID=1855317 RepID=UPI0008E60EDD|nr:universal stress protein [Variovorax sp. OK605]SFQ59603.1 Nucleotide-binding universal stress protein, UspA family [Variovorax sp. OK605]
MFKRILVATDGSALSQRAVDRAISMAASNQAELVALTVVPRYPQSYLEGAMSFSAEDIGRAEKQWADRAQMMLDGVRDRAQASGVRVQTTHVSSDLVAESIIAAAKKHHSDLIVMASHGRKGLQRLLLGSETQHVLTHSALPVLVLP